MIKNKNDSRQKGFTLVELLIVVSVIAILAIVGYVAYGGIQNRAREAVVRSDLKAAADILNTDFVRGGGKSYPETMSNADGGNGLPASIDTRYQYTVNNTSDPPTFCLTGINDSVALHITEEGVVVEDACEGHAGPDDAGGGGEEEPPVPTEVIALSAGGSHTCAIADGNAYCWGLGASGQLGNSATSGSNIPVAVSTSGDLFGKTATAIAAGDSHTCAVADGNAYCWGLGTSGRLGNNSIDQSNAPAAVTTSGVLAGKTVTAISAGTQHSCAIADGQAFCWGSGIAGRLGNSSTAQTRVPVAVTTSGVLAGKTVTAISAGDAHTCAIADGAAYCWGNNSNGRLGNDSTTQSTVPVAVVADGVLAGKTVTAISAGTQHSCAIADGQAFCWGNGTSGRLGNAALTPYYVPVATNTAGVLAGKTLTTVAASNTHSCAVASAAAHCWGAGANGRLGNGAIANSTVPVAVVADGVLAGKTVTSISAGTSHVCAIAGGAVYCWGLGSSGQLGNGSTDSSSVPVATDTTAWD